MNVSTKPTKASTPNSTRKVDKESLFTGLQKLHVTALPQNSRQLTEVRLTANRAKARINELRAAVALQRLGNASGVKRASRGNRNAETRSKNPPKGGQKPTVKAGASRSKIDRNDSGKVLARRSGRNSVSGNGRKMVPMNQQVSPYLPWPKPSAKDLHDDPDSSSSSDEELSSDHPDDWVPNKDKVKPFKLSSKEFLAQKLATISPLREELSENPPVAQSVARESKGEHFEFSTASIMTKFGPGVRMRGREFLTAVTTGTISFARGGVIYAVPVTPASIPDQRLLLMSQLYTRYIFKTFKVTYEPTAGTLNNGSIMMYGDYDPEQNGSLYGGDGNLRYAYTHDCAEASIWESQSVTITDEAYNDMLYVDPSSELRWCVQGNFWMLASGAIVQPLEMGKLILDYEIDFALPDYGGIISNPTTLLGGAATYGAVAGGANVVMFQTGLPKGLYLMIMRSNPTTTMNVYENPQSYLASANNFVMNGGMAFWILVQASGNYQLSTTPITSLGNDSAYPYVVANGAITAGGFSADYYQLQLPSVN